MQGCAAKQLNKQTNKQNPALFYNYNNEKQEETFVV